MVEGGSSLATCQNYPGNFLKLLAWHHPQSFQVIVLEAPLPPYAK